MLLRLASDWHVEFMKYNKMDRMIEIVCPSLPTDSETTLCLAGDVGLFNKYESTLKPVIDVLSKRFRHVVYVYGNHEWYYSSIWGNEKSYWTDKELPKNFHILDDDYLILNDVIFIGSTLWTNYNNRDPLAMFHAQKSMNDFNCIKKLGISESSYGPRYVTITPEDTVNAFDKSVSFIKTVLRMHQFKSMTKVVITHHLPSEQSVNRMYAGDLLNHAFYSNLDDLILEDGPDIWLHGHTHSSCDYILGKTRMIVNPFGYHAHEENKGYNPKFLIDLELEHASINSEEISG